MPLFIKNFSSDACFSKVPAADQESPYKTDIFERDYKTDIIEGRATGLDPGSESCCTQRQMDDGACAGNQVSRLRMSKLMAGGKLQSTWEYNMPLCWLIQPTIRLNN